MVNPDRSNEEPEDEMASTSVPALESIQNDAEWEQFLASEKGNSPI